MDTQQDSNQERKSERKEQRERSPQDRAREIQREGDRVVTTAKAGIEDVRNDVMRLDRKDMLDELKKLTEETDAAWDELAGVAEPIAKGKAPMEAPSAEDLAWEIPEETVAVKEPGKVEKYSLTEDERERAGEIMEQEIESAFQGNMNAEKISALFATEDGELKALDALETAGGKALDEQKLPFDSLEMALSIAERSEKTRELMTRMLEGRVGSKYAEKIMTSPEFRKTLKELQKSLDGTLGEDGPEICSEQSLENLIAIHETIGTGIRELVASIDLSTLSPDLKYWNTGDVLQVTRRTFDQETDEFVGQVDVNLSYESISNGADSSKIKREFYREVVKDKDGKVQKKENGEAKVYTHVEHALFELPTSLQGGDIAKQATRRSLEEYKKMGLDSITLAADIDIGSYAWAVYGYGWDTSKMVPDAEGQTDKTKKGIKQIIDKASGTVLAAFKEANVGAAGEEIAALYAKFLENPGAVTPQALAETGKNGPSLYKGINGVWYTEEGLNAAIASGEVAYEDEKQLKEMKRPFHAGKIGMIDNKWYGKIDLKDSTEQKGKNLSLLQKRISPSAK